MFALIAATVFVDAFFGLMAWFSYAFFGEQALFIAAVLLLPPLATTLYCVSRAQAVRRGENPKF
jgi:hypothetical protein